MPVLVLTAGELSDRIASNLADRRKVFVTDEDLYAYMNVAILVASTATRSISTKFFTFDTFAGVFEYNLPRDAIRGDPAFNVLFDNVPLARGAWAERKNYDRTDPSTWGQPVEWSMRMNKIIIDPPPSADFAGKSLDVHCGQLADKVDPTTPDAVFPLPTEFIPFVLDYATALGWQKRHKPSRYKVSMDQAMFHLAELKRISENIHREAPMRFMHERELQRRDWDVRTDGRYTPFDDGLEQ